MFRACVSRLVLFCHLVVYLSLYLSVYLYICIYQYICLSIHPSDISSYLSVYVCVYLADLSSLSFFFSILICDTHQLMTKCKNYEFFTPRQQASQIDLILTIHTSICLSLLNYIFLLSFLPFIIYSPPPPFLSL